MSAQLNFLSHAKIKKLQEIYLRIGVIYQCFVLLHTHHAAEVSKDILKPQVVPPVHGGQIAEPREC